MVQGMERRDPCPPKSQGLGEATGGTRMVMVIFKSMRRGCRGKLGDVFVRNHRHTQFTPAANGIFHVLQEYTARDFSETLKPTK